MTKNITEMLKQLKQFRLKWKMVIACLQFSEEVSSLFADSLDSECAL